MDDNNKRKKKRGRKNNLSCSCFPSLITPTEHKPFLCHENNNNNNNLNAHITTSSTKNGRVLIPVDNDPHRPRISRLVKAVLFGSLMGKKIHRSSSKSSTASDTNGSYITYDKTSDDNNACVRECADTADDTSGRCRSNLLTSFSSSSSGTICSSSYTTSSCSSTYSTSRSSSQQKSSSSSLSQIDLVDFRHPVSLKSILDQKVSSRMDPRHLRHQDSSVSVSLPLANPKPMNSIHNKSLSSVQKGLSRLDSLDSASLRSLSSLNRDNKTKCSRNNGNILWCFFLFLSLVVLVVYGRIFSILCTSTWFYFVPRSLRIKRVNSSANMTTTTAFVDTDSEGYKKRIIMAGLLDRTRNPFR